MDDVDGVDRRRRRAAGATRAERAVRVCVGTVYRIVDFEGRKRAGKDARGYMPKHAKQRRYVDEINMPAFELVGLHLVHRYGEERGYWLAGVWWSLVTAACHAPALGTLTQHAPDGRVMPMSDAHVAEFLGLTQLRWREAAGMLLCGSGAGLLAFTELHLDVGEEEATLYGGEGDRQLELFGRSDFFCAPRESIGNAFRDSPPPSERSAALERAQRASEAPSGAAPVSGRPLQPGSRGREPGSDRPLAGPREPSAGSREEAHRGGKAALQAELRRLADQVEKSLQEALARGDPRAGLEAFVEILQHELGEYCPTERDQDQWRKAFAILLCRPTDDGKPPEPGEIAQRVAAVRRRAREIASEAQVGGPAAPRNVMAVLASWLVRKGWLRPAARR